MLDGPLHPDIAWPALGIGMVAAAIAVGVPGARRPQVWAGVGAVVALVVTTRPPTSASVGLALLALLGLAPLERGTPGIVAGVLAATIGVGLALVSAGLPTTIASWDLALWLVVCTVAYLASIVGQWFGPATALTLLGLTVAGIWATVPDTEEPLAVAASLAPIVVVAMASLISDRPEWDHGDHPARWIGTVAAVTWSALVGGRARPGDAAAALATYGVLVSAGALFGIAALVMYARRRNGAVTRFGRSAPHRRSVAILVVGQLVTVVVASRWQAARITLDQARMSIVAAVVVALVTAVAALGSEWLADAVDAEDPQALG